jgi:hypothetical protein
MEADWKAREDTLREEFEAKLREEARAREEDRQRMDTMLAFMATLGYPPPPFASPPVPHRSSTPVSYLTISCSDLDSNDLETMS